MSTRVLSYTTALISLLREIQYTLARASQEPLAAAFVPTFQALREDWQTILVAELALLDGSAKAQAAVDKADQGIDQFAGRVSRAVDDHSDGNTRKQIRTALFKNKALSKFRRPVLGGQLQAMNDWSDTLAKCNIPALVALANDADALVAAGQAAATLRDKSQQANRSFRDVGTRKQFIDKLNASRQETHGALAKLPFEHPNLPQDFADGFFHREPTREQEETIDEVKSTIETLTAQMDAQHALLKTLEEAAENAAREKQAQKDQMLAVEELEAQAKALLEQAASLKAKAHK